MNCWQYATDETVMSMLMIIMYSILLGISLGLWVNDDNNVGSERTDGRMCT